MKENTYGWSEDERLENAGNANQPTLPHREDFSSCFPQHVLLQSLYYTQQEKDCSLLRAAGIPPGVKPKHAYYTNLCSLRATNIQRRGSCPSPRRCRSAAPWGSGARGGRRREGRAGSSRGTARGQRPRLRSPPRPPAPPHQGPGKPQGHSVTAARRGCRGRASSRTSPAGAGHHPRYHHNPSCSPGGNALGGRDRRPLPPLTSCFRSSSESPA